MRGLRGVIPPRSKIYIYIYIKLTENSTPPSLKTKSSFADSEGGLGVGMHLGHTHFPFKPTHPFQIADSTSVAPYPGTCVDLRKFTLIILNIMLWFCRWGCVSSHDVVIHKWRPSEQTETPRTAQHTTHYVFCWFLQPVTDSVFKLLVPYHRTWKNDE